MEMGITPIVTENNFLETYKSKKFGDASLKKIKYLLPLYGNRNLTKIISYLTFDGHLSMKKNIFYLSGGKINDLKDFKNLINQEFKINGKIIKTKCKVGKSYKCLICNKPIARILNIAGVPDGAKVKKSFNVPNWIIKSHDFCKEYLKIAFDCEGGIWVEGKNRIKIRFRINKSRDLIKNCINFLESIRKMLLIFGIKSSRVWVISGGEGEYGHRVKGVCLNILAKYVLIFRNEIGFREGRKKKILEWGCRYLQRGTISTKL